MSTYKDLMKKIEAVQSTQKEVKQYPLLCEAVEPGKVGFKPKNGDLLVCPINVPIKKKTIITNDEHKPSLEDAMGIFPYIALVMESGCEDYTPGDVVCIDPTMDKQMKTVVVSCSIAVVIPSYITLGTDVNLSMNKKK